MTHLFPPPPWTPLAHRGLTLRLALVCVCATARVPPAPTPTASSSEAGPCVRPSASLTSGVSPLPLRLLTLTQPPAHRGTNDPNTHTTSPPSTHTHTHTSQCSASGQ